ncbi:MAG: ATP-binding protein [Chitinispirillia bacterium]|nr:ATP-binding protein [Chitinispirillia bacterium]MCL2242150.1 ATP-binding protein [Chitinispirillia bacterium]
MRKFYNRENETARLKEVERRSHKSAQMTFVAGRRRVGKTTLLNNVFAREHTLYFFVSKNNEAVLCQEFIEEIKNKLGTDISLWAQNFAGVFSYLMDISARQRFTLIIDEFQEFYNVNPSIYSSMQNIWDTKKDQSKINLILCGSVYSMMTKIFLGAKEPLFGRATSRMKIERFGIKTIKEILRDNYPQYTNEDLLTFYLVTGGVAKYTERLADANAFTLKKIINEILYGDTFFLEEGRNTLIDEFGCDYGNYFAILSLIASSKTSRAEIESIMHIGIGGFLERLENEYSLIAKIRPVLSKPAAKTVKFRINDNFLNFWFRFIYKYRGSIEIKNYDYVKDIILRDYKTYSGHVLERYFMEKIASEENISLIGTYWEKGNQNEIDIVALNEDQKTAVIAEVKRSRTNINLNALKNKAAKLAAQLDGYNIEYRGLSMEDMG